MADSSTGDTLGAAYMTIHADDSQLPADLAHVRATVLKDVDSLVQQMTARLNQAGSTAGGSGGGGLWHALLGGAAAGGAMAMFQQAEAWMGKIVHAAAEAEQSQVRLKLAMKSTADTVGVSAAEMKQLGESMSKSSTFSDSSIRSAQTAMLGFQSVRGDNFKNALKTATDLAAFMGQDLPAATQALGMAMQYPEHGMQRLRREGVALTEQQMDYVKAGVTAAQQQSRLLEVVQQRVAGSAEAMRGTLSGQFQMIGRMFEPVIEQLGKAFAPAIGAALPALEAVRDLLMDNMGVIQSFGGGIKDFFDQLKTWINDNRGTFEHWRAVLEKVATEVGARFSALWKMLAGDRSIADVADAIMHVVDTVVNWIGENSEMLETISAVLAAIAGASVALGVLSAAFAALASPIGLTVAAVAGLAVGLNALGVDFGSVLDGIIAGITNLPLVWEIATTTIALGLATLVDLARESFAGWAALGMGAWGALKNGFMAFVDVIKAKLERLGDLFSNFFSGVLDAFQAIAKGENPLDAFRAKFQASLKDFTVLDAEAMKKIGEAAGRGWTDGVRDAMKRFDPKDTLLGPVLAGDLDKLLGKFRAEMDKVKNFRAGFHLPGFDKGKEDDTKKEGSDQGTKGFKYVGFEDLGKQIQESIKGDKSLDTQKQIAKGVNEVADKAKDGNELLKKIGDGVTKLAEKGMAAVAVFGA